MDETAAYLGQLSAGRIGKRARLIQLGINPYPAKVRRTHTIGELVDSEGVRQHETVDLVGRLTSLTVGAEIFMTVEDATGGIFVVFEKQAQLRYATIIENLDRGDWVGIRGVLQGTANEPRIAAAEVTVLCKALLDLPEAQGWASDRARQHANRSVDLAVRPAARRLFQTRVRFIRNIRHYLEKQGMCEVETPVLRSWYDIVCIDQFETRDVQDRPLYMRLCHEDRLKQLLSGGFEKVYELGKSFRRDNVSQLHVPEFLQLETIQAYSDYHDMMRHAEDLFATVTMETLGRGDFVGRRSGRRIDLAPPWRRLSVRDALMTFSDLDIYHLDTTEKLRDELIRRGVGLPSNAYASWFWSLVAYAVEKLVETHLIEPTILYDYPVGSNWLCKRVAERPDYIERFEFYIDGVEMGNCYTLTNDPIDFLDRLRIGLQECEALGQGRRPLDTGLILAKAYGLPPFSESSFGVERWFMAITEQEHIGDVILMPYPNV